MSQAGYNFRHRHIMFATEHVHALKLDTFGRNESVALVTTVDRGASALPLPLITPRYIFSKAGVDRVENGDGLANAKFQIGKGCSTERRPYFCYLPVIWSMHAHKCFASEIRVTVRFIRMRRKFRVQVRIIGVETTLFYNYLRAKMVRIIGKFGFNPNFYA